MFTSLNNVDGLGFPRKFNSVSEMSETGSSKYYKCATVGSGTWTGYERLTANAFGGTFALTTTSLTYTDVPPTVGLVYDATGQINILQPLERGLISFFPFTSDASDTQGGHNGTATNVTFGVDGAVFGGNGYISIASPFSFVDMSEATMIMHVEIDSSLTNHGGVFFDNNEAANSISAFLTRTADVKSYCYPNTAPPVMAIGALTGKLAFTRSATSGLQKIIFGASSQSATLQSRGGQGGTMTTSTIGYSPNGSSPEYYFKGKIKNFAIYNRELTSAEMSYWN